MGKIIKIYLEIICPIHPLTVALYLELAQDGTYLPIAVAVIKIIKACAAGITLRI